MLRPAVEPAIAGGRRRFIAIALLIGLLALALRLLYVFMAQVEYPIRGDINQYVLYAWNLTHRGVFSTGFPDAEVANPDSYRGPAYPVYLSMMMWLAGHSDLPLRAGPDGHVALGYAMDMWMRLALIGQALLGAATVLLTIAVARLWLARRPALLAGLLAAFWPHLITFTGTLLSETLFAFLLLFSLWILNNAERARSPTRIAVAGFAWGLTYFVNPVVGFFPLLAAGMLALRSQKKFALVFSACFVLAPVAWAVRNAAVTVGPGSSQRALENFVQGSWPQYHVAYNTRLNNEVSRQISSAIEQEIDAVKAAGIGGVSLVLARMSEDPAYYLGWYLIRKPYLLWDWPIQIGWKDIYFLPTEHSPFVVIPLLTAIKEGYEWINPLFFLLAGMAILGIFFGGSRRSGSFALHSLATLALYLTAMHVLLQAEPRYSIPYRPEEILLSVTAAVWLGEKCMGLRRARRSGKLPPPAAFPMTATSVRAGCVSGALAAPL